MNVLVNHAENCRMELINKANKVIEALKAQKVETEVKISELSRGPYDDFDRVKVFEKTCCFYKEAIEAEYKILRILTASFEDA